MIIRSLLKDNPNLQWICGKHKKMRLRGIRFLWFWIVIWLTLANVKHWNVWKSGTEPRLFNELVPRRRLELPWPCGHWHLKPARLPIPPPGHVFIGLGQAGRWFDETIAAMARVSNLFKAVFESKAHYSRQHKKIRSINKNRSNSDWGDWNARYADIISVKFHAKSASSGMIGSLNHTCRSVYTKKKQIWGARW